MRKNQGIAVAAAIVVVFGFFGVQQFEGTLASPIVSELSARVGLNTERLLADRAWAVLESYIAAAREHNLQQLRELSHQLSPACQDPAEREECERLMNSVAFFVGWLEREQFINTEADERQIVLYTDYVDGSKVLLYFTRKNGEPKLLSLRFCTEGEEVAPECFDDPELSRTDANNNGWWDVIEARFR